MIVEATPGLVCNQARATRDGVLLSSFAIATTVSITSNADSVRFRESDGPRPADSGVRLAREYLPLSAPARRGDQGVTPRPISNAMGISSPSTERSSREYSIC